jgi:DNA-binding CsgD family transcriptional regulator
VLNVRGEGLLTPREDQVVRLVAEGIGNRDVALQLGVKENTVKKSLLRIYDKLGVSNRVELVLYALTHSGADSSTPSSHQSRTDLDVAVECLDPRDAGLMDAAFDKHSGN